MSLFDDQNDFFENGKVTDPIFEGILRKYKRLSNLDETRVLSALNGIEVVVITQEAFSRLIVENTLPFEERDLSNLGESNPSFLDFNNKKLFVREFPFGSNLQDQKYQYYEQVIVGQISRLFGTQVRVGFEEFLRISNYSREYIIAGLINKYSDRVDFTNFRIEDQRFVLNGARAYIEYEGNKLFALSSLEVGIMENIVNDLSLIHIRYLSWAYDQANGNLKRFKNYSFKQFTEDKVNLANFSADDLIAVTYLAHIQDMPKNITLMSLIRTLRSIIDFKTRDQFQQVPLEAAEENVFASLIDASLIQNLVLAHSFLMNPRTGGSLFNASLADPTIQLMMGNNMGDIALGLSSLSLNHDDPKLTLVRTLAGLHVNLDDINKFNTDTFFLEYKSNPNLFELIHMRISPIIQAINSNDPVDSYNVLSDYKLEAGKYFIMLKNLRNRK